MVEQNTVSAFVERTVDADGVHNPLLGGRLTIGRY